jgi:hypothetical protein
MHCRLQFPFLVPLSLKLFRCVAPALVILIAGGLRVFAQEVPSPVITRNPYIQMVSERSGVVAWRTGRPIVPLLAFGEAPDALTKFVLPHQVVLRVSSDIDSPPDLPRLHSAPLQTFQFEAHIKGLEPDKVYFYAIFDFLTPLVGGDSLHWFRTAPAARSPDDETPRHSRFWVVGDSGDGSANQRAGFQGLLTYLENEPEETRKRLDAYIHVGDMAYTSGKDQQFSANFFGVYGDLLRNICTWPSMGNHEGRNSRGATGIGPYYDAYVLPTRGEAGGVPSGTEAYYSFDFGDIHFICLDSHDLVRTPTGAMAQWLKADLESVAADWMVAFWHHPPYTKGTHDSDRETQLIEMRQHIMPLLESAGVDLVLTGHSHTYERSMLMDGAYGTPTSARGVILDDGDGDPNGDGAYHKSGQMKPNEGSVSVVAGHGRSGRQFYGIVPVMRKTIPVVGSFLLDIDGDVLTGRMIVPGGHVADFFQIVRRGEVQPVRVEHPWQPFGPTVIVAERTAGHRQLEMYPFPAAPDALVRYQLDGEPITEASPVYTDPIPLSETGAVVSAATIWRQGTRISPVTTVTVFASAPRSPSTRHTIVVPLSDSSDDAWEDLEGNVRLNNERIVLGSAAALISATRFTGVGIPEDVFVLSARVQFQAGLGSGVETSLLIGVEQSPNAAAYEEVPHGISSRNFGEIVVPWNSVRSWGYQQRGEAQTTPDLSALVNSVTGSEGWVSGNAITFGYSGSGFRDLWTFDRQPVLGARLEVTYDSRSPVEIAHEQPFSVANRTITQGEEPEAVSVTIVEIRYRELVSGQQALLYQFEFSRSLQPDSWVALPEVEPQRRLQTGSVWGDTLLQVPLAAFGEEAITELFFRRRIEVSQ